MRPKAGASTKAMANHHPKKGVRRACMRENKFIA